MEKLQGWAAVTAFPGPVQGLRCSAVGAAPPEPLRSLSAPDAIARQQLPVHLQFYP